LFHLGALWRINELGLLPRLARISRSLGVGLALPTPRHLVGLKRHPYHGIVSAVEGPCPTSLVAWKSPSLAGTRSSASSATVGRRSSSWDETPDTSGSSRSRCCDRSSRWPSAPSGSCGRSSSPPG